MKAKYDMQIEGTGKIDSYSQKARWLRYHLDRKQLGTVFPSSEEAKSIRLKCNFTFLSCDNTYSSSFYSSTLVKARRATGLRVGNMDSSRRYTLAECIGLISGL
jgi:hypothetical protein